MPANLHNLPDVYGSLAHPNSAYPTFPNSLHHGEPIGDHNASNFGVSSPAEPHASPSHTERIEHNGMHLDPNLSPGESRQFPSVSESTIHHESTEPQTPSESKAASTPHTHPPPIIPNSAPPGNFDMLPPPTSTHPSWKALHDYAQSHASAHGYALSINTTAKNRSRIKLACVCYGAPKNTHKLTPETRVRKSRVSYKTGCKMWVEGKKQEDGMWVLRVGEGMHNHVGRASEGWAVQRKRTWGVEGGRVGVGGVTAMEEKEKLESIDHGQDDKDGYAPNGEASEEPVAGKKAGHSLERGGLVWKIVEQEMLRKGVGGHGRDRGVVRTVKILEERLPGIHIFKRDVYNIRAQIKRARKAAGQQLGEGLDDSEPDDELDNGIAQNNEPTPIPQTDSPTSHNFPQIDPTLIAQCDSALKHIHPQSESEVERLRREVEELRQALAQKTKENETLRVQLELANVALYNERGVSTH